MLIQLKPLYSSASKPSSWDKYPTHSNPWPCPIQNVGQCQPVWVKNISRYNPARLGFMHWPQSVYYFRCNLITESLWINDYLKIQLQWVGKVFETDKQINIQALRWRWGRHRYPSHTLLHSWSLWIKEFFFGEGNGRSTWFFTHVCNLWSCSC